VSRFCTCRASRGGPKRSCSLLPRTAPEAPEPANDPFEASQRMVAPHPGHQAGQTSIRQGGANMPALLAPNRAASLLYRGSALKSSRTYGFPWSRMAFIFVYRQLSVQRPYPETLGIIVGGNIEAQAFTSLSRPQLKAQFNPCGIIVHVGGQPQGDGDELYVFRQLGSEGRCYRVQGFVVLCS